MKNILFLPLLLLMQSLSFAQGSALSPQHQITILQYAGPKTNTLVPVAMLNQVNDNATVAARWLADLRVESLMRLSFNPKDSSYIGDTVTDLEKAFANAADQKALLFIDDCDALWSKAGLTNEEKSIIERFYQLAKKHKHAVLIRCVYEPTYFAMAKAGFGIVALDL
ncbi:MAG: AAA family ATPase [Bacteroidetes bacterium]|jgi:ATPase family associated with various cellular activities (AAA).|uniref:AAA family ATPase n=1 Tax=Phnomibacter sp. TaxID=2836217 RepID=UPI002FDE9D17|nr:AAA family ATPase [Bacteroidota bacterium]